MKYYFVSASLPELHIGYPPELTFNEFTRLLKVNLTEEDYDKTVVMRRIFDIQNVRNFLRKEPFDHRSNLDENQLEEAILTRFGLPDYVYDFLDRFDSFEDRMHFFPSLVSAYYRDEIKKAKKGFLLDYLSFEHNWRLVFTGFRAKKLGRDISVELQFEDFNDDIVAQILAQKDSRTYEPPSRFEDLKVIFEKYYETPLELAKILGQYRFDQLREFYQVDWFSIDRILAYLAQLVIAEKWMELDKEKGLEIVESMIL